MNLPDQIKQESIKKMVEIAKSMINEDLNLIEGSREIHRLRFSADNPEDDVFNTFILTVSDTDDIPLGENVRKNYGSDYLKEADEKMNRYLDHMKQGILESCQEIIKKYSSK